jgi:hypothetical protein
LTSISNPADPRNPGAAILGDGIVDTSSSMAVISPQHDLALAISASDGDLQANHLISGEVQEGELVS